MNYIEFIFIVKKLSEHLYRLPDEFFDLAKESGIVIFKPYMGDNAFVLEGAINDMINQPDTGSYQPQLEDLQQTEHIIKLDSAGFVDPKDVFRYQKAAHIDFSKDWLMDIPHDFVKFKPNTHSRAWYLIFQKDHLTKAPEGARSFYETIY